MSARYKGAIRAVGVIHLRPHGGGMGTSKKMANFVNGFGL